MYIFNNIFILHTNPGPSYNTYAKIIFKKSYWTKTVEHSVYYKQIFIYNKCFWYNDWYVKLAIFDFSYNVYIIKYRILVIILSFYT